MKYRNYILAMAVSTVSLVNSLPAQEYYKSFEKKLTPSPAVSAFESYAGMELKKNSGGVQKSIPLFSLQEGDLSYSPSIEYFSTGIKVDDWGSRVGIGWTENLTAVISRTVRGIPDEKASNRTGDGYDEFGSPSDFTTANYSKVQSLSVSNSYLDGEYDLYSYNIFGLSGSFIIKNGQALLIKDDNSVKIQVLQGNPLHFLVRDNKGNKYYFDAEVEGTQFSSENACDVDNPNSYNKMTTAWFLDRMVSPGNNKIDFVYSYVEYSYIYDFADFWSYSTFHLSPPWFCPDPPGSGDRTACLRKKITRTKILDMVIADNLIVIFDYLNRDDIYGEKILKTINVYNRNELLKVVTFNYNKVVATSSLEAILVANMENDPWEYNALKTRYFLTSFNVNDDIRYKFKYYNPSVLPHRFSLSKDYMGCYNGKINAGLVSKDAIKSLQVTWDKSLVTIPFADRSASSVGIAGLLSSVMYPTGGRDSIEYESNRFDFVTSNNTVIDSIIPQYRVKRLLTQSGASPDMIKTYSYNVFNKVDDQLQFTNKSSLVVSPSSNYVTIGAHVCSGINGGSIGNLYANLGGLNGYPLYTVRDKPNYSPEVYGGLPYAYRQVTEFAGVNDVSVIASEFRVSANAYANKNLVSMFHPEMAMVSPPLDNSAWDNGLETQQYIGGKVGNQYFIDQSKKWNYSNTSTEYYNYSASKAFMQYTISADMEWNIGHYIVKQYAVHRHWTKLDSISEQHYFRKNNSYSTLNNQTVYKYFSGDHQLEEEETRDSKNDLILKRIYRPAKMVSLGLDPSGVYQGMINNHVVAPEVKVYSQKNGQQTAMVYTNYFQPYTNLFVPQSIYTQQKDSDPLRLRFNYLKYDTRGNVLSVATEGGLPLSYLYSYSGKYPVIKVVGATYQAIENILGAATISNFQNNTGRDALTFAADLNTYVQQLEVGIPTAVVSSYRYNPHVGVIWTKEGNDLKRNYLYDYMQRLRAIQGESGVLKTFEYNYKGN